MIETRKIFYSRSINVARLFSISLAFYLVFFYFIPDEKMVAILVKEDFANVSLFLISIFTLVCLFSFYGGDSQIEYSLPSVKDATLYTVVLSGILCPVIAFMVFLKFQTISFLQMFCFFLLAPLFFLLVHLFFNYLIKKRNNLRRNKRHVLFVGSNQRIVEFSRSLELTEVLGFTSVGFIDSPDRPDTSVELIGSLDEFPKIIKKRLVDAVIVHLPLRSHYDEVNNVLEAADEQGIPVSYLNDIFERTNRVSVGRESGLMSTVTYHSVPPAAWKLLLKRVFDLVFSFIAVVILSPLLIVVGIGIFFQDGLPLFFLQRRIGYKKRTFTLYKFRSMRRGAHKKNRELRSLNEMDGPVFKIKNDPRIFPFGHFIRKYSLDELPQLFNVLLGNMSIVGPRPLALEDYHGFKKEWLQRRFSVKPGLTCYWQVMDNRNDVSFDEWMRLDMKYIDNWTFAEDFKIILKTVRVVLTGQGA